MVFLGIFFVSFFLLTNSFFIGRIIKRVNMHINSYFAFVLGFISFFVIVQVVSIYIYLGGSRLFTYQFTLLSIQSLLLALYIWNWKFIVINKKINYHNIFLFCLLLFFAFLSIISIYFITDQGQNYLSQEGQELLLHTIRNPLQNDLVNFDGNASARSFSAFSILGLVFRSLIKIENTTDANNYLFFSYTISYCFVLSAALMSFITYQKRINSVIIALALLITILINLINFMHYEIPSIAYCWIMIGIAAFFYNNFVYNHQKKYENRSINNFLLLFYFSSLTNTLSILIILLSVYLIFQAIKEQTNVLYLVVYLGFYILYTIINQISLNTENSLLILFELFMHLSFISWIFLNQTQLVWNVSKKFNKVFFENKYAFIFFLLMGIYCIALYSIVNNQTARDFYIIKADYIWNIKINDLNLEIINIVIWVIYFIIGVNTLIYRRFRVKEKRDSRFYAYLIFILVFYLNPIAMHFFVYFFDDAYYSSPSINLLLTIPLFISLMNIYTRKQNYSWYEQKFRAH